MIEIWKPVPGYNGRYEASNTGKIRSWHHAGRDWILIRKSPKLLKPGLAGSKNKTRYFIVNLNGKCKKVHRLVLEAFVSECPKGYDGAHLNGDSLDNRLENLKWCTRSENILHKRIHKTMMCGEKHISSKLTANQVRKIRNEYQPNRVGYIRLANKYGVRPGTIFNIIKGKSWTHI